MRPPRHLKVETCVTPTDAVRALRKLVLEAEWNCRRIQGSKLIDRWMVIVPIAQGARTLGLVIEDGPMQDVAMEAYSHVQGSAGAVCVVEWLIPNHLEDEWRDLFANWTARLPRCPWKWTFRERSTIGYLLPVYGRSKKTFRKHGVNVAKGSWPAENLPAWPPNFATKTDESE